MKITRNPAVTSALTALLTTSFMTGSSHSADQATPADENGRCFISTISNSYDINLVTFQTSSLASCIEHAKHHLIGKDGFHTNAKVSFEANATGAITKITCADVPTERPKGPHCSKDVVQPHKTI